MIQDDEYQKLIENYSISYKKGDIVKGIVVDYERNNVLVDINSKATAICPNKEVLNVENKDIKDILEKNKEYTFIIASPQDEDGIFYLSHKKVALKEQLDCLKEKIEKNETVIGKIISQTKGGILVNVSGIKGFVPLSQIKIQNPQVNENIELKILTLDLEENNFILSNKKVYEEEIKKARQETLEKIELNMVVKGKVTRLTDFGAFVGIGGIDGLLPLSQISWSWIEHPSDILKENETIEVEIIGIDKENERISLSYKSLQENPWLKAKEEIKEKETYKGKVIAIKKFGAFIQIYPKVEGLINNSQMNEYYKKYKKNIEINDTIEVLVKKFNPDSQKIILEIV